mmetsp:Transcript_57202/g.162394  ORF Transcript_57202/g.162394 Transcript_57202/m.162394 type:complete len:261 (+) Transcript_57202:116-898(+)
MNYNADTDMDLDWAADQLRRQKNLGMGLPDTAVRRLTSSMPSSKAAMTLTSPRRTGLVNLGPGQESTLGHALSALDINSASEEQCRQICDGMVQLLGDRDRTALHAEFVELKGVEAVLEVVRHHGKDACLAALQVLDKLSRTSAREIAAAGGIDVVVRCAEKSHQAPRIIEAVLRTLHGMTFDEGVKNLLLRRGVRELVESLLENKHWETQDFSGSRTDPDEEARTAEAWQRVVTIATRVLQRLGGGGAGGAGQRPRRPM